MPGWWSVPPLWRGATAFIVAGGPSVAGQNIQRLFGRRVIAVNSSWEIAPFAQYLIFGDRRWWNEYGARAKSSFAGEIVTCNENFEGPCLRLRRIGIPKLCTDPREVFMRRTTLTAAVTFAVHLGAIRIVLLGADGKRAADGRTHHHAPHPWEQRPNCWDEQREDLLALVCPLVCKGVEVLNASPGSAWDMWPIVTLDTVLGADE